MHTPTRPNRQMDRHTCTPVRFEGKFETHTHTHSHTRTHTQTHVQPHEHIHTHNLSLSLPLSLSGSLSHTPVKFEGIIPRHNMWGLRYHKDTLETYSFFANFAQFPLLWSSPHPPLCFGRVAYLFLVVCACVCVCVCVYVYVCARALNAIDASLPRAGVRSQQVLEDTWPQPHQAY